MSRSLAWVVLPALAFGLTSCASQNAPLRPVLPAAPVSGVASPEQGMLVSLNTNTGRLEYWPIAVGGGHHPTPLSGPLGIHSAFAAAAFGNTVVLANQTPPEIVLYNVSTQSRSTLPDTYGTPIDVAVDRQENLYVLNLVKSVGNIAVYPDGGTGTPFELNCAMLGLGEYIAVDNEGDVFVNGYPPHGAAGVIEIPNATSAAPEACSRLPLRGEPGYVGGVAVDPNTDDLITLDNPDDCAGGIEARMRIYSKPYGSGGVTVRDLDATYCGSGLRLDATSSHAFFGDASVSGGYGFIQQRTFPEGQGTGIYGNGSPGGFTTIPAGLPN
ncbi:MAG: hypothetical protein JO092_00835 [Candidatus Eremiobacteraeota bacterium]|nr:hypothetical protein [Candidatus Eremiobacteraeota bacterium]